MRMHIGSAQAALCGTLGISNVVLPEDRKPTLGWGKHSVRLYAGRSFGAVPRTPCP